MNLSSPPPVLRSRYRLVEWLGRGATGTVYRAFDATLERYVAVKFLPPGELENTEESGRFLSEARTLAQLAHPHIMTVHDAGDEEAWLYLVFEFIPGAGLDEYRLAQGGRLPPLQAARLVEQALQALAYAHAQGVLHRNLKPENLRITPAGELKVMDFGLSLARGQTRLTRAGSPPGALLYLAPEVFSGRAFNERSDLFALGCVFYELLGGRPPFEPGDLGTWLRQDLSAPLQLPGAAVGDVATQIPPRLEEFVLRLLQPDPAQRYPTAKAALDALQGCLATMEAAARPGRPPEKSLPGAELPVAGLDGLELERRRLAGLLQQQVLEPLNLLLDQANAFESSLAADLGARRAVAVLAMLARQAVQQAHDLEADLHPALLEALGLEPALEALAAQMARVYGLRIELLVTRLSPRLPERSDLALYRFAQAALQTLRQAHATAIRLRLAAEGGRVRLECEAAGRLPLAVDVLQAPRQWLEGLGGQVIIDADMPGVARLAATLPHPGAAPGGQRLTARELEVLRLAAEGLSNKAIAGRLFLAPRTVNYHLDHIYAKLGVNSRTEAVMAGLRLGLIQP